MQRDILRVVSRVPGAGAAKRAGAKVRETAARSAKKAAIGLLAVAGLAGLAWMTSPSSTEKSTARDIASSVRDESDTSGTLGSVSFSPLAASQRPAGTVVPRGTATPQMLAVGPRTSASVLDILSGTYAELGGKVASSLFVFAFVTLAIALLLHALGVEVWKATQSAARVTLYLARDIAAMQRDEKKSLCRLLAMGVALYGAITLLSLARGDPSSLGHQATQSNAGEYVSSAYRSMQDLWKYAMDEGSMAMSAAYHSVTPDATVNVSAQDQQRASAFMQNATLTCEPFVRQRIPVEICMGVFYEIATLPADLQTWAIAALTRANASQFARAMAMRMVRTGLAFDGPGTGTRALPAIADSTRRMLELSMDDAANYVSGLEEMPHDAAVRVVLGSCDVKLDGSTVNTTTGFRPKTFGSMAVGSIPHPDDTNGVIPAMMPMRKAILGKMRSDWESITEVFTSGVTAEFGSWSTGREGSVTLVDNARTVTTAGFMDVLNASEYPAPAAFAIALNPGQGHGGLSAFTGDPASVSRVFDGAIDNTTDTRLQKTLRTAAALAAVDCHFAREVETHASVRPPSNAELQEHQTWIAAMSKLMMRRFTTASISGPLFGLPDPLGWLDNAGRLAAGYSAFELHRASLGLHALGPGSAAASGARGGIMRVAALMSCVFTNGSLITHEIIVRSWETLGEEITNSPVWDIFMREEINHQQTRAQDVYARKFGAKIAKSLESNPDPNSHAVHSIWRPACSAALRILEPVAQAQAGAPGTGHNTEQPKQQLEQLNLKVATINKMWSAATQSAKPQWHRMHDVFNAAAGEVRRQMEKPKNATRLIEDIVEETPKARGEAAGVGSLLHLIETRLSAGITGEDRSMLVTVLTDQASPNTIVARKIRVIAVGIASGSVVPARSREGINAIHRMLAAGTSDSGDAGAIDNISVSKAAWTLVCKNVGFNRGNVSNYAYTKSAADSSIITLTPPSNTTRETVPLTLGGLIAASAKPAPAGYALAFNPGPGGLNSYGGRGRSVGVILVFDNFTSADSAINTKSTLAVASAVAGLDSLFMDAVSGHAQDEPNEPNEPNGGAGTKLWEVSEKFEKWATELGGLMSVRLVLTAHLSALFGLPSPIGWLYEGKSESGAEMGRVGYVVFRLTGALAKLRVLITSGTATGKSSTPALMQVVALIQTVLPATKTSSDRSDKSDKGDKGDKSDTSVALADTTVRSWTSLTHGVTGSQIFLWFLEGELDILDNAMPENGTIAALHHGAYGLVWHAVSEARRVIKTLIYDSTKGNTRFPPEGFDGQLMRSQLTAVRSRMSELGKGAAVQSSAQWLRLEGFFQQALSSVMNDVTQSPATQDTEAPSAEAADATQKKTDTKNTANDTQKESDAAAAETVRQKKLAEPAAKQAVQFDVEKKRHLGAPSAEAADATQKKPDTKNTANDTQKEFDAAAAETARQKKLAELAAKQAGYRAQFDVEKNKYLGQSYGTRPTRTKNGVALELIRKIRDFKPDSGSPPTNAISTSWDKNLFMWWTSGAVNTPEFAVVAREALKGPHFQGGNLPYTQEVITMLNEAASSTVVPNAAEYGKIIQKWEPKDLVDGADDVKRLSDSLLASLKNAHKQKEKIEEELAAQAAQTAQDKNLMKFFDKQVTSTLKQNLSIPKQVSLLVAVIALERHGVINQGPWYVHRKGWDDSGLLTQISHKLLGEIFRAVLKLPRFQEGINPRQVALVIPMIDAFSQPDAAIAGTVDTAASIQTVLSKLDELIAAAPQCAAAAQESPSAQACEATKLIRTMLLDAIEKCNKRDAAEPVTTEAAAFGAAAARARRTRKQEQRRFL